ncbi:histone-lysine N-methyltransferase SETMAR [Trichonephila clavipes]|nr:histone-lysine N-methyltransferase SETMAR [Trichonephila clavipes]
MKFRLEDFSLKDEPRSGRSSDISHKVLREMIRSNLILISTEVSFKLGIHQTTALGYIKRLGFLYKLSVWVLIEISESTLVDRISICSSILARHKRGSFWDHLMAGDEKWIMYRLVVRKKAYVYKGETLPSESGDHQKKVMLCCWYRIVVFLVTSSSPVPEALLLGGSAAPTEVSPPVGVVW